MAITKKADRNHDALFPKHESILKMSDPELIEIFDNWAFDEVIEDAPLDARLRLLVQLASLIACQSAAEFRVMVGAALQVGVTPVEIKELVYQAVPYRNGQGVRLPARHQRCIKEPRRHLAARGSVDDDTGDKAREGTRGTEAPLRRSD